MKILMINTQASGVGYYRTTMPAEALLRAGHDVTYSKSDISFFYDYAERKGGLEKWLLDEAWKHDVVHMGFSTVLSQISTINGALRNYALTAHKHKLPIAADIDDDPLNVPSYNTAFRAYQGGAEEKSALMIQLRTADGVSVTKPSIASSLHRDGKNFAVLPNYTHPPDWIDLPVDPHRDEDKSIRVMFAGGHGHKGDIDTIKDEMIILMNKYDGKEGRPMLRVFWLGCTPDWILPWMEDTLDPLANRSFYLQPCGLNTYHRLLRWVSPDIFIAPVAHNAFNESKSCIKAYDAVTADAAFLCSDWPTYEEVPQDCAFKHSNNMEWKEMLEAMILDPELRKKKAAALKDWTLTTRQIDTHISKWVDFYTNLRESPIVKELSDVIRPRIITEA